MKHHFLGMVERVQVEQMRSATSDKESFQKLSILILLDMGKRYEEISESLGIGVGTIGSCKNKYESEGLGPYLAKNYVPYMGRLTDVQLAQLDDEVSKGLYTTIAEVARYIQRAFEVTYSERAVCAILHKLGFVHKLTSEVPSKANPLEQEAFLAEMEPFLKEIASDEAAYFIDAVHPQHNTRSSYAWIKKGDQKTVPTNSGRGRLNINGAMNAHRPDEIIIHESDTVNSETTIELFEKILLENLKNRVVFGFCDQASYYSGAKVQAWLKDNPKFVMIQLPTYSPNLNLIERLWKFMRKKVINLNFYSKFKQFRAAILEFFADVGQYKEELISLMAHNFQRFPVSPVT